MLTALTALSVESGDRAREERTSADLGAIVRRSSVNTSICAGCTCLEMRANSLRT